ncbi:MAG: DinB family protein [Acidobacteria bacterium]|nr:DinB family protein [Acidobacteriota bacterium]
MSMAQSVVTELDQEAIATRRLLERIPSEKLDWKPHPKARTLGQLAVHIAQVQKHVSSMIQNESGEVRSQPETVPSSATEIVTMFDDSHTSTKALLGAMSDEDLVSNWSLMRDGQPIFTLPKIGMIRMVVLNHVYHHRGQLSTYLRTLDVALPSIYGPSADENPFA